MKTVNRISLLFLFALQGLTTSAQFEVELIELNYTSSGSANFIDSPYASMDQMISSNSNFGVNVNYGHNLTSDKWSAIYSLSYNHISQELDLSGITDQLEFNSIPRNYYRYPDFSQVAFSSGLIYQSSDKWTATMLGTINFTDDLSGSQLKPNLTWLTIAYAERKHSENFSYGLGVFMIQLENNLIFTPSASLKLQNEKRGVELLFPEKIRLWQRIRQNDYIEALIKVQSLSVEYPLENVVNGLDIYTIQAGVRYNLLLQNFVRLSYGIDFPLMYNSVDTTTEKFNFVQQNSVGFNLGVSIIIPDE